MAVLETRIGLLSQVDNSRVGPRLKKAGALSRPSQVGSVRITSQEEACLPMLSHGFKISGRKVAIADDVGELAGVLCAGFILWTTELVSRQFHSGDSLNGIGASARGVPWPRITCPMKSLQYFLL